MAQAMKLAKLGFGVKIQIQIFHKYLYYLDQERYLNLIFKSYDYLVPTNLFVTFCGLYELHLTFWPILLL